MSLLQGEDSSSGGEAINRSKVKRIANNEEFGLHWEELQESLRMINRDAFMESDPVVRVDYERAIDEAKAGLDMLRVVRPKAD